MKTPMDARSGAAGHRSYEDFQPELEWVQEDGLYTLWINLPDFKKEQIRIQVDDSYNMKITGERPLDDNKWSRFQKDVRIPDDCNLSALRAKYEGGNLNIVMPRTANKPKYDKRDLDEATSVADKSKQGVGELVMGLYRPRKLKVNIVAASLVVVALAVYVTYKIK